MQGVWLRVDFPRIASKRLQSPAAISGNSAGKELDANKGSSVLCIPGGNVGSSSHAGPPYRNLTGGLGDGQSIRVQAKGLSKGHEYLEKWAAPALNPLCFCLEHETAWASGLEGSHREALCIFSSQPLQLQVYPVSSGAEDSLAEGTVGSGLKILGSFSWLCHLLAV